MAEQYRQRTPLAHRGLAVRALAATDADARAVAGVVLGECGLRGQAALRGDAGDPAFVNAIKQAIGSSPPTEPNTVAGPADLAAGSRVLWLGPDEWLVVDAGGEALVALRATLDGRHAAVVDVSDSRAVIALSGPRARGVLAKGCPLDLHPRVFTAGRCAQTLLSKAHVILHQIDDAPSYEIYVHRSFADYLWTWLEDAAAEYGIAVRGG
jgi:sarcosine oxidase, subunit gamma